METYSTNLDDWYFDKSTKSMINENTGEIISDRNLIIALLSSAKDNIKRQKDLIKDAEAEIEVNNFLSENHIGWKVGGKTLFIKLYRTERREMLSKSKLSVNSSALLLHLENYIEYPTNRIAKPDKSNFTNLELTEISGLGGVQIKKALNELEEKSIIKRIGKGRSREIFFNPYISSGGNEINKNTIKMFNENYTPFTPY